MRVGRKAGDFELEVDRRRDYLAGLAEAGVVESTPCAPPSMATEAPSAPTPRRSPTEAPHADPRAAPPPSPSCEPPAGGRGPSRRSCARTCSTAWPPAPRCCRPSSASRRRSCRRSRTRSWPATTSSSSASAARPRPAWPGCSSACSTSGSRSSAAASSTTIRSRPSARPREAIVERDGDETRHRLAAARPALRREAGDAGHHHRRPHRRGRPDQGRRGPLPVGRADAPLRPDPARQPRHRRDQRAARPRRADPGRPAQRARGARRPDPRLHRPPAARPVRRRLGQPRGLHQSRGRIITPLKDRLGSQIRTHYPRTLDARDGDRPPGEASVRRRARAIRRSWSCRRSWRRSSPS